MPSASRQNGLSRPGRPVPTWANQRVWYGHGQVVVVGSLILGVLAGGAAAGAVTGSAIALLGTGLCGALTTYSTFGYETLRLAEDGARRCAALNAVASVLAGLGAAFLGWALAAVVWA